MLFLQQTIKHPDGQFNEFLEFKLDEMCFPTYATLQTYRKKFDLEKVKEGVTSGDDHVTTAGERKHIDNYDPDSPNILKRKIGNSRLLRSTISRLCVRGETRDHY